MVQELITYAIVAVAVAFTLFRIWKKFGKKKKVKPAHTASSEATYKYQQHNCSDCSAECILRDVSSNILQSKGELCKKIESSSD